MIVELRSASKAYGNGAGRFWALREATLVVDGGDDLAIVGPSGSGKSTMLYLLGCLDRPTKGQVLVNGVPTENLSDRQLSLVRRHRLGFVFQQYYLNPSMSALENVLLPMELGRVPERRDKARAALAWVGLERKATSLPSELSGGEQQRVAIARALANRPELVLADEPTGNLDSESGARVLALLSSLNSDKGSGLVVVTHDEKVAERAGRRVHMQDGRLQ